MEMMVDKNGSNGDHADPSEFGMILFQRTVHNIMFLYSGYY